MFEHRIENREQLPHAGDERHFLGLSGGAEPLIEGPEYRIAPHGNQGAHVEGGPDHSPAAPGGAPAPQGSTIAIQGGNADQGGDLVAGQGSRLRQLGNQRAAQDRSHARHTLQQVVPFSPDRGRLNVVSQLLLDRGYLAVQLREVLADLLLDPVGGIGQPILLHNPHLNELPSATDQGTECLSGRIGQVPRGWPDRVGKAGQHLSLNRIGLGEPARRFGNIADLTRVHHGHGQSAHRQGRRQRHFQATGGLQHNSRGLQRPHLRHKVFAAGFRMGEHLARPCRLLGHVQLSFRDIDTNKERPCLHGHLLGDAPVSPNLARCGFAPAALATVRAPGRRDVTTTRSCGLTDLGAVGLSRPDLLVEG